MGHLQGVTSSDTRTPQHTALERSTVAVTWRRETGTASPLPTDTHTSSRVRVPRCSRHTEFPAVTAATAGTKRLGNGFCQKQAWDKERDHSGQLTNCNAQRKEYEA